VVAVLPGPVHTHLNLAFDSQVDAIEQAIEWDGYLFARATMPWDYHGQDNPEPSDFRTRLMQKENEKNKEQLPGLMIFRKTNSSLRTTSRYTHFRDDYRQQVASDLGLFSGIVSPESAS
jgi:hypothetical protein